MMIEPSWKQGPDFPSAWDCENCGKHITEIESENNDDKCPHCGWPQIEESEE